MEVILFQILEAAVIISGIICILILCAGIICDMVLFCSRKIVIWTLSLCQAGAIGLTIIFLLIIPLAKNYITTTQSIGMLCLSTAMALCGYFFATIKKQRIRFINTILKKKGEK